LAIGSSSASFPSPVLSGITASIFGGSLPFYVNGGTTASGTLSVVATEYFPFDTTAHTSAIYNTVSGSQILSPLPVDFSDP
jgi:hypothetical protein